MNTLWASLLGLILIALAVVLAFNFMQGRQTRLRDAWREKLAGGGARKPAEPRPVAEGDAATRDAAARDTAARDAPARDTPARGASTARIEPTFGGTERAPMPDAGAPQPAWHHDDEVTDPAPAPRPEPGPARTVGVPTAVTGARGGEPAPGPAPRVAHDTDDRGRDTGADNPVDDDEVTARAPTPSARTAPDSGAILDPRLDCIVELTLGAPVAPERLLQAVSTLRRAGSKPVAIEADAGDGHWAIPTAARGVVRRVRAGVLLANRNGPLNAMEFSEFSTAVQGLGRAVGAGGAVVPDMAPVLEHARQLDDACAQLDAVIGLNVETPTALSPAELAALAFGLGLSERGNNRFAQLGEDGEVLFSLALGERAEQLTLLLDVPRAPPDTEPWAQMVDCAMQCAERTGGRLVDDAGRPLTESAVGSVGRQLAQRYRSLEEAGLDAGSPAALRVFN